MTPLDLLVTIIYAVYVFIICHYIHLDIITRNLIALVIGIYFGCLATKAVDDAHDQTEIAQSIEKR